MATTTRASTGIGLSPPTRSISPSSSTRSSLDCIASGMSPISSRKSVPPAACSNFPMWRVAAPVKEPFSWPKSSDSISSAGTAAQLSVTKGPACRALFWWIVRAISSLPVPVSPWIATRDSLAATRSTCAISRSISGPGPDHFVLAEAAAQIAIFVLEMAQPQDIFDGDEKFFRRERLFQKIHGAEPRGPHRRFHAGLPRNHHHRRRHSGRLQILEQRNSILAGHHHVRKNHVEMFRANRVRERERRCRTPWLRIPRAETRGKAKRACSDRRR